MAHETIKAHDLPDMAVEIKYKSWLWHTSSKVIKIWAKIANHKQIHCKVHIRKPEIRAWWQVKVSTVVGWA